MRFEQLFQAPAQVGIPGADFVQEGRAFASGFFSREME
jgi:hypothetical protein